MANDREQPVDGPGPVLVRPYDASFYLRNDRDCALYLQAAIDESEGDPAIVIAALEDIARARGSLHRE